MELILLGVNHRVAGVADRERLAFDADEAGRLLAARGALLPETLILSTCNRVELYAFSPEPEAGAARLAELVRETKGLALEAGPGRVAARGPAAAQHLLRVATGLDSLVLGEGEILGQVRDAWDAARGAGSCGPHLDRLLSAAIHAGKRARHETAIGTGAVSVASAAVALATRVFGDLAQRRVLVIGAGQTGRLAARHFAERRPAQILVANRSRERAEAVAADVGGRAVDLAALESALAESDVAICATSAPGPVVTAAAVQAAMRERRASPLVLVDIAVPRDVEAGADAGENVFLYPIDALRSVVDRSLARRRAEVPRVEAIVEEESRRFEEWLRGRDAAPVVRELREHFERVRAAELEKSLRHFPEPERQRVERLTRSLVNKLLHVPTTRLKDCDPSSERGLGRVRAVRELFALDAEKVDRGA